MHSRWSAMRSVSSKPSRCAGCTPGARCAANACLNRSKSAQPAHASSQVQGDCACDHKASHASELVGRPSIRPGELESLTGGRRHLTSSKIRVAPRA